ncbi:IS66 family transposase OrfB [Oleiphilus messinensis]|uniref:IS66 family transposase OrfB n=1 Tax=Oleiphilus messinensis TaxID=141451 RepID=A0A1Y0IAQ0_9GAMM|nr:IS66 family insertion sequence element accessory protein TnpB [Oleiphilus messinensis]ARU57239.1 IS66 family transposase OrfB [Oleiphilus messinensis]
MFTPSPHSRIWLYTKPTDMRKSFKGLIGLVRTKLREIPSNGQYFVFINRRKTHMKILYFEPSGYCIWTKRLEQGQFHYKADAAEKQGLNTAQLQWLIEGIEVQKYRQFKRYSHVI